MLYTSSKVSLYFCPPQVHRWVNYESMLKECLVGRMAVKPSPALQGSLSTFDSRKEFSKMHISLWKHNYFHTNMLFNELEMKKSDLFDLTWNIPLNSEHETWNKLFMVVLIPRYVVLWLLQLKQRRWRALIWTVWQQTHSSTMWISSYKCWLCQYLIIYLTHEE